MVPHAESGSPLNPHDLRCTCGQLMAKWRPDGLEVKCQGCKRMVLIPFSEIGGWPDWQR